MSPVGGGTRATGNLFSPKSTERGWKRGRSDRRYGLARWRKTRLRILERDGYRCFAPGCAVRADVVDHIEPAHPGMPDSVFFDPRNLRASCRRHNAARGWQTYAERELGTASSQVVPRDYGRRRP